MKKIVSVILLVLLPSLLFAAQIKPQNTTSKVLDIFKYHDSGNYLFRVSNYGTLGSGDDIVPQWPSLEYPKGSGIDFLYTGALWFSAKKQRRNELGEMLFWQDPNHEYTGTANMGFGRVIDTLTTVGFDGDDDYYELLPAYNPLEYVLGNQYTLYNPLDNTMKYYSYNGIINFDDDGDGLVDEDPIGKMGFPIDPDSIFCFSMGYDDDGDGLIDEDGGYFGYENLRSYFYDYSPFGTPGERVIEAQSYAQNHIPLNIAISHETFCWPLQYFNKIALIKTTIYNMNPVDTLFDFALGYYIDCDIGPQSWSSYVRAGDDVSTYSDSYNYAYSYDKDFDGGLSVGYVAARVFPVADNANYACWTWEVGDGPSHNVPCEERNEKYWLMTHNANSFDPTKYISLTEDPGAQLNDPCDTRFMYSYYGDQNGFTNPTGNSLNLEPGDSVIIYSAVFLGDTTDELEDIASQLQSFYEADFDLSFLDSFMPDLFFSEYIEGTSQNKAIEIYNPTNNQIDLTDYQIAQAVNGNGWQYYHEFPDDAVLEPYDVWVITTDEADDSLQNVADEILSYPSVVHFSGDDARGLEKTTDGGTTWTLIDIIGNPDEDPGSGWDVAGIPEATYNHTIVRKDSIFNGNIDWTTSAGVSAETSEWIVYPLDTFQYLGWHNVGGDVPETFICTSQGDIDSLRVGAALNFMLIGSEITDYYKYRLVYYENTGTDTLHIGPIGAIIDSTDWHSTANFEVPDKLLLKSSYPEGNPHNKPLLRENEKYPDGTYEVTQLQVKAVSYAGLEDSTAAHLTFFVRDYFIPDTAPFMASWADYLPDFLNNASLNILPHVYLLGQKHYLKYYLHSQIPDHPIPEKIISGEYHFGNPFYVDTNENFSAIWSQDMELHLWWSYLGEFEYTCSHGRIYAGNTYFYDENLDEYIRYYCDIEYMDIQLDGGTSGLPSIGSVIIDSLSGEEWMRITIDQDQSCMLTNLSIGEHTFKVRAIDIQGAVDPSPEELVFTLHESVDASQSDNILLVDDTQNQMIFAIEDSVNNFYQELVADYSGIVEWIDLQDLVNVEVLNRGVRQHGGLDPFFAPSDIQSYKMILWYANDPKSFYNDFTKVHLVQHYDIMRYYLDQGGSLLFTGTANICDPLYPNYINFLEKYGGLADTLSALSQLIDENNWLWGMPNQENSMFVGAHGVNDFNTLDPFNLNLHIYKFPTGAFFPEYWVMTSNPLGKIGNVTFLNPVQAETIFTCITDTMAIHQQFADAPVGTKYVKDPGETGAVYTLGFPLYYMEIDDAKTFMDLVYADLDSLFSIDDPHFVQDQPYIDILSYPNPVTLSSNNQTFSFNFKNIQNVVDPKIKIYNIKGQLIKTIDIPKENLVVSKNSISSSTSWDFKDDQGKDILDGVYFYKIESKSMDSAIKKIVIIR
ncbi:MAG: lamin tail domain-containing protein [Candidatus Cloacimonetes bacterium]|nr:lamin tail domain-containing protein [Candidatus Cloacimonadota bacterium]